MVKEQAKFDCSPKKKVRKNKFKKNKRKMSVKIELLELNNYLITDTENGSKRTSKNGCSQKNLVRKYIFFK